MAKDELLELCPLCGEPLTIEDDKVVCSNLNCVYGYSLKQNDGIADGTRD